MVTIFIVITIEGLLAYLTDICIGNPLPERKIVPYTVFIHPHLTVSDVSPFIALNTFLDR